mmetsp:Transcript_14221/g.24185  ORF Transcript_14221/g.24185 Transcript_14221/m.24185 type:complete len:226 (-) Transcript_14221:563-1240(-)
MVFGDIESCFSQPLLFLLTSLPLLLSGVAAALLESTIVGYLRVFSPEQIEDFGMGTSLAQMGDIFIVFLLNNFKITTKFAMGFVWLTILTVIPLLFSFNALQHLKLEQGLSGEAQPSHQNSLMEVDDEEEASSLIELKERDLSKAKKKRCPEAEDEEIERYHSKLVKSNVECTLKNLVSVLSKIDSDARDMFILNFYNDVIINLIILLQVSHYSAAINQLTNHAQ